MKLYKALLLLFLQLNSYKTISNGNDSLLFIEDVKKFAFQEMGTELKGEFFAKWSNEEKPFLYLYVSLPDSIKKPVELTSSFIFCGTDENKVHKEEANYKQKGYHTFCYKTNANSSALLNKRLISYSKDAIAFIIFHELIHNYISQNKMNVAYEYNEALCDVIGNYGTVEYLHKRENINSDSVKHQLNSNEEMYKCMNKFIREINLHPNNTKELNNKCSKRIHSILQNSNFFQKDRFNYEVNNAYLLKNEYYCKNYFLLKRILQKQKTIKGLLEIMKFLPEKAEDCEKYLKKFT